MTKFDPVSLKQRRAFSMNSKTNVSDGEWSADDINSGYMNSDRNYSDDIRDYM
jgi:hypothetical protein